MPHIPLVVSPFRRLWQFEKYISETPSLKVGRKAVTCIALHARALCYLAAIQTNGIILATRRPRIDEGQVSHLGLRFKVFTHPMWRSTVFAIHKAHSLLPQWNRQISHLWREIMVWGILSQCPYKGWTQCMVHSSFDCAPWGSFWIHCSVPLCTTDDSCMRRVVRRRRLKSQRSDVGELRRQVSFEYYTTTEWKTSWCTWWEDEQNSFKSAGSLCRWTLVQRVRCSARPARCKHRYYN